MPHATPARHALDTAAAVSKSIARLVRPLLCERIEEGGRVVWDVLDHPRFAQQRDEIATALEAASEWWARNPGRLDAARAAAILARVPSFAQWGHGAAADALLEAAAQLRSIDAE